MKTNDLPSITIITPSYNQGQFIEETINSVLGQNYPYLEYIIMDGGSTDNTCDILRKYNGRIKWFSKKDRGQSDAINQGIRLATGEIIAYLNSDDLYKPGTLLLVGKYFKDHPNCQWLTGRCEIISENGQPIRQSIKIYKDLWLMIPNYKILNVLNFISQPATFWRKSVLDEIGYLDENLVYNMDYDLWLRIGKYYPLHVIKQELAAFRMHRVSKSISSYEDEFTEDLRVLRNYTNSQFTILLHQMHNKLITGVYKLLNR